MSVQQIYSLRSCQKLTLPKVIQDSIAKLRIVPSTYRPPRIVSHHKPANRRTTGGTSENWRENALVDIVRRVKERDDPEYAEIFSIFNKIVKSNVDKMSIDIVALIQKRDNDEFRLRVVTLLFDKAITQPGISGIMAICAKNICDSIPEVIEDLQIQIHMFPAIYDMNQTIVFPNSTNAEFEEKVIQWMKQKDKRRGFAKFLTNMFVHGLVTQETIIISINQIIADLQEIVVIQKTSQSEENVGQLVEYLHETVSIIPKQYSVIRDLVKTVVKNIRAIPKEKSPSLNMRCRFKLDEISALV